jgi:hypothetical protein
LINPPPYPNYPNHPNQTMGAKPSKPLTYKQQIAHIDHYTIKLYNIDENTTISIPIKPRHYESIKIIPLGTGVMIAIYFAEAGPRNETLYIAQLKIFDQDWKCIFEGQTDLGTTAPPIDEFLNNNIRSLKTLNQVQSGYQPKKPVMNKLLNAPTHKFEWESLRENEIFVNVDNQVYYKTSMGQIIGATYCPHDKILFYCEYFDLCKQYGFHQLKKTESGFVLIDAKWMDLKYQIQTVNSTADCILLGTTSPTGESIIVALKKDNYVQTFTITGEQPVYIDYYDSWLKENITLLKEVKAIRKFSEDLLKLILLYIG